MIRILLSFLFLISVPHLAEAELIFLKNGEVVRGKIVKITPVYVRIDYQPGVTRREFLTENIDRIEPDPTQDGNLTPQAIKNIQLRAQDEFNQEIRKIAMEQASMVVKSALKDLNVLELEESQENIKLAAMEMANLLIEDAIRKSNSAGQRAAAEPAKRAALEEAKQSIEASIKNVEVSKEGTIVSKTGRDEDIGVLSQMKNISLFDSSYVGSKPVTTTPPPTAETAVPVQTEIFREPQHTDGAGDVPEKSEAGQDPVPDAVKSSAQKMADEYVAQQNLLAEPEERPGDVVYSDERQQIKRLTPKDKDLLQKIDKLETVYPDDEDQGMLSDERVALLEKEAMELARIDTEDAAPEVQEGVVEVELEEREVPVESPVTKGRVPATSETPAPAVTPVSEEAAAKKFQFIYLLQLGSLVGVVLILIGYLLFRKRTAGKTEAPVKRDIQVERNMVFQNLPDELTKRLTQSDVEVILRQEKIYEDKIGFGKKGKESVIIDQDELAQFIKDKTSATASYLTLDDIKKVLEIRDNCDFS